MSFYLLLVVCVSLAAVGGVMLCSSCGHAPRLGRRKQLTGVEESEIAIVCSKWADLDPTTQANVVADLLRGTALISRSLGGTVRYYVEWAADRRGGLFEPTTARHDDH